MNCLYGHGVFLSFDFIYSYQTALQSIGLMLHLWILMIGIQSKTQKGNFETLVGHQSVGNLIIFALLKDRTEGKFLLEMTK